MSKREKLEKELRERMTEQLIALGHEPDWEIRVDYLTSFVMWVENGYQMVAAREGDKLQKSSIRADRYPYTANMENDPEAMKRLAQPEDGWLVRVIDKIFPPDDSW